jgi:hypothetical protein
MHRRRANYDFFISMAPGAGGFRFEECNPILLVPMKTTLLISALVGVIASPVVALVQTLGGAVPAWLSFEHIVLVATLPWLALLLIHSYRPRPSAHRPQVAAAPRPALHLSQPQPAARRRHALDATLALLGARDATSTINPL